MSIWIEIIVGSLVLIAAISDLKWKRVNIYWPLMYLVVALAVSIFTKKLLFFTLGLIPGAFLIGMARLTKEKIGYGDGLVFLAIGAFLGAEQTLELLLFALLFCSVIGILLIIGKKIGKKEALPFFPFVLAAYFLIRIMEV